MINHDVVIVNFENERCNCWFWNLWMATTKDKRKTIKLKNQSLLHKYTVQQS